MRKKDRNRKLRGDCLLGEEQYVVCKFGSTLNCGGATYVEYSWVCLAIVLAFMFGILVVPYFNWAMNTGRADRKADMKEAIREELKKK